MEKRKIIYITETSLPSNSANIINTLKFCDALCKFYHLTILLPDIKISKKKILKNYSLKNKIKFKSILNKKIKGKFEKIFFFLKIIYFLKNNCQKGDYIIGRSIFCSIFLSFFNKKNTLEIHHNLSSITKILFKILMLSPYKKNISFILINKTLINELKIHNQKYIVLDDGADVVEKERKNKIFSNTCVYIGSFYPGKGIEIITKLSKILPDVDFHLYGDFSVLKERKIKIDSKNIKFIKKLKYREVYPVLKKYHVALMPYQNKIMAKSKNLEISKYISPLKMFDYLAAGNIIIASRLKAYNHVLKNNFNAFVLNNKNVDIWKKKIYEILKKPSNYKYIKKNALNTAKIYSWNNRAKKILTFLN